MRSLRMACLAVFLLVPAALPVAAQNPNPGVPPILISGLDAYRTGGMGQAFRAWLRNSPLPWDPKMAVALHSAEQEFGPFQGWDIVDVRSLTPTTRVVYLVLNYQLGPVFAKFVAYDTEQQVGWVVTNLKFSLDDEAVFPPPVIQ